MNNLTVGKPTKVLLYFALPILITNLCQQFYLIADMIIVGKALGELSLSAIGNTASINGMIISFATGVGSGLSILSSQYFGANDKEKLKESITTALILSIIISIILTITSLVITNPILKLMHVPDITFNKASSYIKIIFMFVSFNLLFNYGICLLRALSNYKAPLVLLISSNIINIIISYVLVNIFHLGVEGAALASAMTQVIMTVIVFIIFKKDYKDLLPRKLKINKSLAKDHLKLALPLSLQFSLCAIGGLVLDANINMLENSPLIVASINIAQKITGIASQLYIALGAAIIVYMGQNLGAKNYKRIKDGVKSGIKICLGITILISIFTLLSTNFFIHMSLDDPSPMLVDYTTCYVTIAVLFYPALGAIFLFRNTLQGLSESFIPMMGGIVETIARILGAYTLVKMFSFTGAVLTATSLPWTSAAIVLAVKTYLVIKSYNYKTQNLD